MSDRERLSDLLGRLNASMSVIDREESFSERKKKLEIASLEEDLAGKSQDRKQRGIFAMRIFGFVCFYMAAALTIVVLDGCCVLDISDTVLVTMLGTTTANVIGLFLVVAEYLFHRHK